jgi:hypothetical protein
MVPIINGEITLVIVGEISILFKAFFIPILTKHLTGYCNPNTFDA